MPETLLGGIAINEILADPNGANNFDTDGNGNARGADEYIELVNTSGSAIDISGLELWDRARDDWFTFPPGTVLEPGAVAMVVRNVQSGGDLPSVTGDNLAFDANVGNGVFNNNGDNLVVYDPANDEYIQATYNGDTVDDPVGGPGYSGFSATATRSGAVEDFGNDQDGFSIQRGSNGFTNDSTPTPGAENVCFASGTLLDTPTGFRAIEDLRVGDFVQTFDSGYCRLRWIYSRKVTPADVAANPALGPITVHSPTEVLPPLQVSRHHRLLITGEIARRMFDTPEILVPAKDIVGSCWATPSVVTEDIRYFHLLLDGHHILNANGWAAESLFLGLEALNAMTPGAQRELQMLFPDISRSTPDHASRLLASGARARRLVWRHGKNNRALVASFA